VIKLPNCKNSQISVSIPFEVYIEISGLVALNPNRAHLFEWGHGNFLFMGLDGDVDFVKHEGKKDVRYLMEKERVRDKANLNNARYWNLKKMGIRSRLTPRYDFYFDKQHHRQVMQKVPIACDIRTRQKYYYYSPCGNCGKMFFSKRNDARFCNMRTCQKRKKN
jgi:hypothetical protein